MQVYSWSSLLWVTALGGCAFKSTSVEVAAGDARLDEDAGRDDRDAGPDAHGPVDAPPPAQVVLRETASDVVAPGTSVVCYAAGAQSTRDGTWRRVFRLADFGVTGAFQVDHVTFAVNKASAARGVVVRVGTYAGSFGAATLDPEQVAPLATATVDVPDGDAPQPVTVPIAAHVPAGALLVVDVAAPSLQGVGYFNLGATSAGETAPGYFSSEACAFSPPKSTVALGGTGHLVIGVVGVPR